MKTLLQAIITLLVVATTAHAECSGRTEITDQLIKDNNITVTFLNPVSFRSFSTQTYINGINAWKKYWGTARSVHINFEEGTMGIPAGTQLVISKRSTNLPGDANAILSSGLAMLLFEENANQIYSMTVHYQPYSTLRIHHLEKLLGARIECSN